MYHASTVSLEGPYNVTPSGPVLKHKGSGFEYDQVADPSPVVGSDGGEARLYYDGDNNVVGQCSIGMATAHADN